jgi:ubiquitin carboxyl-terminal hydrolase L5
MAVARANIYQRIGQYDDDGLQFNLLSLCKSPLCTIPEKLAQGMRSILAIEQNLTAILPNWKEFTEVDGSNLLGDTIDAFGLSKDLIDNAEFPESAKRRLVETGSDPSMLINLHRYWTREQAELRDSYVEEAALIGQENEQAARRKHDYTQMIYNSVKSLAEKELLREIVKEVRAQA